MKECRCGRAPYEFRKDSTQKDGLDSYCKQCRRDYHRANKDKALERGRRYEKNHKARKAVQRKQLTHVRMKQIQGMAKAHVTRWNKPHLETELASDLILRAARGQDINQNAVTKSFIDILRTFSGRKGSRDYAPYAMNWKDLDDPKQQFPDESHAPRSRDDSLDLKNFVDRKYPSQRPGERACYFLKYVYGFTHTEICEIFGTFYMNVQPTLDNVERDLKVYLGILGGEKK